MNIEKKRNHEIEMVCKMIDLYCRKHHHTKSVCPQCQSLKEYAAKRTSLCPFMANKSFCSVCKVHCYKEDHRSKIKEVMRFSGPRLIFSHPILVLKHGLITLLQKKEGASQ